MAVEYAMPVEPADCPLVIDLDGTLLRTDSLHETLLDAMRTNPRALLQLPVKLLVGRSAVKAFLAEQSPLDVATWPVNQDFLEYVERQVADGRKVVLATAADRSVAEAVAARFPFISEVIASDGCCNMSGATKAERLRDRFPQGFIYAGDSTADLEVWRHAAGSVVVNAPGRVMRSACSMGEPLAVFPRKPIGFSIVRRSLRLHQWAKNALVFVPLMLDPKMSDASAWLSVVFGFVALGLVASATYVVNDLWDLPRDRRHWSKKARPLASGDLPICTGALWVAATGVTGFAIAWGLGLAAVAMLAVYVAGTLSYTFLWKRVPLLDITVLAGLFTHRLLFGILIADVPVSQWLLVFSMFVFLSLSTAKRHAEVLRVQKRGQEGIEGRGYIAADAPMTLGLGLASMLGATIIMILYLINDALPHGHYANPTVLWAMPPILFLGLGRIWLVCQRGQLNDDPVAFALTDRTSAMLGAAMGLCLVAAHIHLN